MQVELNTEDRGERDASSLSLFSCLCPDVFLLEIFEHVSNDGLFGYAVDSIVHLWSSTISYAGRATVRSGR